MCCLPRLRPHLQNVSKQAQYDDDETAANAVPDANAPDDDEHEPDDADDDASNGP